MIWDTEKLDAAVMEAMERGGTYPTYVLRNILVAGEYPRDALKTSHVLTACKRLLRSGKIEQLRRMSSNSYVWKRVVSP